MQREIYTSQDAWKKVPIRTGIYKVDGEKKTDPKFIALVINWTNNNSSAQVICFDYTTQRFLISLDSSKKQFTDVITLIAKRQRSKLLPNLEGGTVFLNDNNVPVYVPIKILANKNEVTKWMQYYAISKFDRPCFYAWAFKDLNRVRHIRSAYKQNPCFTCIQCGKDALKVNLNNEEWWNKFLEKRRYLEDAFKTGKPEKSFCSASCNINYNINLNGAAQDDKNDKRVKEFTEKYECSPDMLWRAYCYAMGKGFRAFRDYLKWPSKEKSEKFNEVETRVINAFNRRAGSRFIDVDKLRVNIIGGSFEDALIAVKNLNPDWSAQQVLQEVKDRIRDSSWANKGVKGKEVHHIISLDSVNKNYRNWSITAVNHPCNLIVLDKEVHKKLHSSLKEITDDAVRVDSEGDIVCGQYVVEPLIYSLFIEKDGKRQLAYKIKSKEEIQFFRELTDADKVNYLRFRYIIKSLRC